MIIYLWEDPYKHREIMHGYVCLSVLFLWSAWWNITHSGCKLLVAFSVTGSNQPSWQDQANLHGNHVNNTGQLILSAGQLVQLGHHLPLQPPVLLLLHQGPDLAGPELGFESWIQTEGRNFPHFLGRVHHLSENPYGGDMVVLPGAVQGGVRILLGDSFRVDPAQVLQDGGWRVLYPCRSKRST